MQHYLVPLALGLAATQMPLCSAAEKKADSSQPNIIFILIDDQRYDLLSYLDHPWIKTPNIDKLAARSVYFRNAFVTTSLCSPSRASILTGMYAHAHGVVDNDIPLRNELPTFPKELQKAGYKTALIGKWHMGGLNADPKPGFDFWLSFEGQGKYIDPEFNINGSVKQEKGYTPDILTTYALNFIEEQTRTKKPYCLYLSHKSIHEPFTPAEKHQESYRDLVIPRPESFENNAKNNQGKPEWVVRQRKSWHGAERESLKDFDQFFREYSECMLGVDESIGRITGKLEELGELENTVIIYFSDNGYLIGEHGLIDKRVMYEESIRVPCFIYYPQLGIPAGKRDEFVLNIDLGPTILDIAGVPAPTTMHGKSLLPLLKGEAGDWRSDFIYEYYIDPNAVQTPTIFGLRNKQYSYITTHGVWDNYELYDIQADPKQSNNLLGQIKNGHNYGTFLLQVRRQNPELFGVIQPLDNRINEILKTTGGKRSPSW
jgi:N-acetylglucosamine-6-sulfatase